MLSPTELQFRQISQELLPAESWDSLPLIIGVLTRRLLIDVRLWGRALVTAFKRLLVLRSDLPQLVFIKVELALWTKELFQRTGLNCTAHLI